MFKPYGIANLAEGTSNYTLKVRSYEDAVFMPMPARRLLRGTKAGAFDADGNFIRESGLERSYARIIAPAKLDPQAELATMDETAILGGYIPPHFGHFILESLARLWAIRRFDCPIIWGGGVNAQGFVREIFDLIGLPPERMVFVDTPLHLRRLWVATPGYIIRDWCDTEQMAALAVRDCQPDGTRLYLSRSRFKSSIANVQGEEVVETRLAALGWTILYPEEHSISDQIYALARASVIAGLEGSALHSIVFLRNVTARIIVVRRPKPNPNFNTIALAKKLDQHDISGHMVDLPPQNAGKEGIDFAIDDPEGLVHKIDALSDLA